MTIHDNTIQQYTDIVEKINELRALLSTKLIKLGAINTDGSIDSNNVNIRTPSFSTLLTKANPIDIKSVTNNNLPNMPTEGATHFNNTNEIINFLYTNSTKQKTKIKNGDLAISEINLLLLKKLKFYHDFLSYQLKNMGLPKKTVDNAKTIKNLILLLDRIEITKETTIIYNNEDNTIYINQDNVLPISIVDKYDYISVDTGIINIYENNVKLNTDPIKVGEDIIVVPTTLGTHTYTIEYIPTDNKYFSSTETFTFEVKNPPLEGIIELHNITETSRFFNSNSLDDVDGYKDDNWDIDIQIYDTWGNSINQPIPFELYLEDEVLLYTGITDSLGYATISNINIPYYNSDFIDMYLKEFKTYDTPYILSDEELQSNLTFIKNIQIDDKRITYDVIYLTEEDYIDDINGCVKNLEIDDDGNIFYDVFDSKEHLQIKNINNIRNLFSDLVTAILFNGREIGYETFGIQKYEIINDNINQSLFLNLKTTLNNDNYPDTEILHDINLYHNPISVDTQQTWYKTDPNMPQEIIIKIKNEKTGDFVHILPTPYKIQINNNERNTIFEPIYSYDISNVNLNYNDNIFDIQLYTEEDQYISNYTHTITILSNFEIPTQTSFFLNDTPNIYYKPFGIATNKKKVKINNTTLQTNQDGLITKVKEWKDITTYNLTIQAQSDNLSEERNYNYTIKKPFEIQIVTVTPLTAQYKIKIYNTQQNTIINVVNKETNNILYNTTITNKNQTEHLVTIDRNNNNIGGNELIVYSNEYEEKESFTFYQDIFQLQTNTINVGFNQKIKIKCLDTNISNININGTGIVQKSVTKTNNIFTIICDVTQAFPSGTNLIISSENISETETIKINKGNIEADLTINNTLHIQGSLINNFISFIGIAPTSENITLIFNNGVSDSTIQYPLTTDSTNYYNLYNLYQTNQTPGTYTSSITFVGNNNYNSFTLTQTYVILANTTHITDISIQNNNLLINEVKRSEINNTNIVTDVSVKNNNLLVVTENIDKGENLNKNTIQSITINEQDDLVIIINEE